MAKAYVEKYSGLFNGNIASTSTSTGTLVVTGGVGTSGNVYSSTSFTTANTASTSTSTVSLVVSGGAGVAGNINVGGTVNKFSGGTASTSTGTGTLVVTGGVGVSGSINSAGDIGVGGNVIVGGDIGVTNGGITVGAATNIDGSSIFSYKLSTETLSIYNTDIWADDSANINLAPLSGGSIVIAPGSNPGGTGNIFGAVATNSTSTSTGSLVVIGGVGISGNLNVGGTFNVGVLNSQDLTVSGNLVVNGNVTTINSTTITVDDKNIELGSVGTPTDITADGGGITLKGSTDKTFNWVNSTDSWTSSEHVDLASGKAYKINGTNVLTSSTLGSAITFNSLTQSTSTSSGTLVVTGGVGISGSVYAGGIGIGGYYDNSTWMAPDSIVTTPAAKLGSLGTIGGYSGGLTNATSASTSTSTGTLVVEGGVGISGCLNVGGYVTRTVIGGVAVGSTSFDVGQSSTSTSTGTLVVTGGVGISENLNVGGNVKLSSNTASTTTGTGTLVVTGGVGISGNLNVGGNVKLSATTASTSTSTGTLVVTGGVGVSGNVIAGAIQATPIGSSSASTGAFTTLTSNGATTFTAGTASTTTGTGTLVVTGGVGVSGNLNVGGTFNVGNLSSQDLTVAGNLTVNGTTTTINSNTITVKDKNIELAQVPIVTTTCEISAADNAVINIASGTNVLAVGMLFGIDGDCQGLTENGDLYIASIDSPTQVTLTGVISGSGTCASASVSFTGNNNLIADGGGITLKGSTDKTFNWVNATNSWTSSENMNLASGKVYKINGTNVLTSSTLGSAITFNSNTASTGTSTGTLVVTGGVGISGNVNVGGNLNVSGTFNATSIGNLNPGLTLANTASVSPKISVKVPVDFKVVGETNMFTVPSNSIFLIDSMEIVTTAITSAGTAPTVRLGNTNTGNAYYGPTQVTSNSVGARHIIENPQDGVSAGTVVTCGVTIASTALVQHIGYIKVIGELITI